MVDVDRLVRKHRDNGILIDTNLMVVWVIGNYRADAIGTHKRTRAYTVGDYQLILQIAGRFQRRLTTPNVLTEVDNLSRQLPEREFQGISRSLHAIMQGTAEVYLDSRRILGGDLHAQVGLTDSLLLSYPEDILIMTDDFPLSNRLSSLGRDVINLNHIRAI